MSVRVCRSVGVKLAAFVGGYIVGSICRRVVEGSFDSDRYEGVVAKGQRVSVVDPGLSRCKASLEVESADFDVLASQIIWGCYHGGDEYLKIGEADFLAGAKDLKCLRKRPDYFPDQASMVVALVLRILAVAYRERLLPDVLDAFGVDMIVAGRHSITPRLSLAYLVVRRIVRICEDDSDFGSLVFHRSRELSDSVACLGILEKMADKERSGVLGSAQYYLGNAVIKVENLFDQVEWNFVDILARKNYSNLMAVVIVDLRWANISAICDDYTVVPIEKFRDVLLYYRFASADETERTEMDRDTIRFINVVLAVLAINSISGKWREPFSRLKIDLSGKHHPASLYAAFQYFIRMERLPARQDAAGPRDHVLDIVGEDNGMQSEIRVLHEFSMMPDNRFFPVVKNAVSALGRWMRKFGFEPSGS